MNTQVATVETVETTPAKSTKVDFGSGRYSKVMFSLYSDAKNYLGIDSKKAERLARSFGAELGRLSQAEVKEIKFGKLGKNGDISLKEVCESIKLTVTPAISIAKVINVVDSARSQGLKYAGTRIELDDRLTEWLNEKPAE